MNEIFKFMVFRPPAAVDSDDSKYIHTENPDSNFQQELKEARGEGDARRAFIGVAKQFIQSAKYVSDPQGFFGLTEFEVQLGRINTLKVDWEAIERVLRQYARTLVEDEAYNESRQHLADSILALVIAGREASRNYEDLVRAIRVCRLAERIIEQDPTLNSNEAIEDALNQVIILPGDIFPLPGPQYSPGIESKEEKEKREAKIEQEKRAREATSRFRNLMTALDELSAVRASDFRTVEYQPTKEMMDKVEQAEEQEEKKAVILTLKSNTWILSRDAIKNLSVTTQQEINNLGISLETTPLPEVTMFVEKQLTQLSAEVYKTVLPTKVIKIGNTYVSASEVMGGNVTDKNASEYPKVQTATFREVGIDDLMVVREDIQRYEAGEVAHIENVLKGESKVRSHRKTHRTEETYLVETETIRESEQDLQSTERFEIQREAQQTAREESSHDFGITVKYGGIVDVESSYKFETKESSEQSARTATNYAREVTERSVSRIRERVREQRVRTTIEEIEEKNLHKIVNTPGVGHVVGIYRWVDKVYKAQIINYGARTMYEFILPEPAAFLLYARTKKNVKNVTLTEPAAPVGYDLIWLGNGIPTPLRPEHIQPYNYQHWVAQYQVTDIEPPPPLMITKSHSFKSNSQKEDADEEEGGESKLLRETQTNKIIIPDGYKANKAAVGVYIAPQKRYFGGFTSEGFGVEGFYKMDDSGYVVLTVGAKLMFKYEGQRNYLIQNPFYPLTKLFIFNDSGPIEYTVLEGETKEIPITILAEHATTWTANIEIVCERTEDQLNIWRHKTYDAIMTAYLNLKSAYEDQLAASSIQEGVEISGGNPKLNREVEQTELKRGTVTLLTQKWRPYFKDVGAIVENKVPYLDQDGKNAEYLYPEIDFDKANDQLSTIQFLEQAFEWNQMVYTFYPYFWARKERWPLLQQIEDTDPVHAKFLKAGAARVLIPVRPGYEASLRYFWLVGKPWEGKGAPSVGDKAWLPIIEELKEKYGIYFDEGEGTLTVTKNSPVVKGSAETKFSDDTRKGDKNREIRFLGKTYRIAKVEIDPETREKELTLTENYSGNNKVGVGYAISRYKLVGDPWEIKIPTTLVYLEQEKVKLPDFTKETK